MSRARLSDDQRQVVRVDIGSGDFMNEVELIAIFFSGKCSMKYSHHRDLIVFCKWEKVLSIWHGWWNTHTHSRIFFFLSHVKRSDHYNQNWVIWLQAQMSTYGYLSRTSSRILCCYCSLDQWMTKCKYDLLIRRREKNRPRSDFRKDWSREWMSTYSSFRKCYNRYSSQW